MPFGLYLRYLFKRSFKQTFVLSFLLTLSFELIQRSALFGLYPRPYRLFDVDDLMINTLGSLIGFGIAVTFSRFLPDLDATKAESSRVSLSRRFIAFLVDLVLIFIIGSLFLPIGYYSELIILGLVPLVLKATPPIEGASRIHRPENEQTGRFRPSSNRCPPASALSRVGPAQPPASSSPRLARRPLRSSEQASPIPPQCSPAAFA